MTAELLSESDNKMRKAIEALKRDLATIRTGRAVPALVADLLVDYYGAPTPLNQLATISAPEARLLLIQPWDKQAISGVEKSILRSDLGLNPASDGNVIRVPIPALTQERRTQMVRSVHKKIEDGHVSIRNIRRDIMEGLRKIERNKEIGQDEEKRALDKLQKLTNMFISEMDHLAEEKEKEVLAL